MLSKKSSRAAVAAIALCSTAVNAFWRLECEGSVGLARIDPLMDFDGLSDHVHTLKGGSEKPPFKAYYELNTGSTSNGEKQTVEAFPNGFQMIAGSNYRRNTTLPGPDPNEFSGPFSDDSNDEREQRAIGFNCMNYGHNGGPAKNEPTLYRHSLPEKSWIDSNCPDGIRLELQFPSCWNGEMDGGEKHKSHVAYPNWINGGDCPAGFDKRLPALMYETIVATDKFVGKGGKFVLGNGDPTGYGYHGDFISAWDEGVLERAVSECTDMSGQMKSCGVFEFTQDSASCTLESLPDELKNENTEGPMSGLPGGCEIQSGPEPAKKGKGASGSSSGGKSSSGSSTENKSKDYAPPVNKDSASPAVADAPAVPLPESNPESKPEGGVFAENKAKAPEYVAPPSSPAAPITTNPPVAVPVLDAAGNVIRTDIRTDAGVVYENKVVLKEVTITEGGPKAKRSPDAEHFKRHVHHRHQHMQHGIGGRRMR
ncbi:MAG: hypothetical protein Q9209_004643 [Squamulea sp. 1 TL-2023]